MNNISIIEGNQKFSKGLRLNIGDIKYINNNIDLSLEKLIDRINKSIKEYNFEEGKECYNIVKRIYKNNARINSIGFILEYTFLKFKYSNLDDLYSLYNFKKELSSIIRNVTYLSELEETYDYNLIYNEAINEMNKININKILIDLDKKIQNINSAKSNERKKIVKEIFVNRYENDFYNSNEFFNSIIKNDIYIDNFNSLELIMNESYLLYKFNLEENINERIKILYDLNIDEFMNVQYAYKNYLINIIKKKKYETINDLKCDILNLNNRFSNFNKNSMPL